MRLPRSVQTVAHHQKRKTRRQRSCGLCKPHKRQGNARKAQTMQEMKACEADRAT